LLLGVIMPHDGIFQVGVAEEQVMIKIMTWSCDLKCAWLDTHFFSRGTWKYIQKRISSFWHLNWLQNIIVYNILALKLIGLIKFPRKLLWSNFNQINELLIKRPVDEKSHWINDILIWPVEGMINWWNDKLMKWSVDEMTSWWNDQLMKW
jgi:hypothetical protein